ncbi:MAG: adenylate/guanylate cyclase domain-containing protein [Bdellovibrio sp.]
MQQPSASNSLSIQNKEMLVVVFDLINFGQFSNQNESAIVFQTLNEFYSKSKTAVEFAGGRLIKFIGDAGLAVFEKEQADATILSMIKLKSEIDPWFSKITPKGALAVNCHLGPVTIGGMVGPNGYQLDVIGEAVNIAFTLGKRQFLISPQAFRSLNENSRRNFKKFTPPIVYRLASESER